MVSPIGLSVSTKLAPSAYRAQMMALYFFGPALGSSLSGVLANYYTPDTEVAYFLITGGIAVAVGFGMILMSRWTLARMGSVR